MNLTHVGHSGLLIPGRPYLVHQPGVGWDVGEYNTDGISKWFNVPNKPVMWAYVTVYELPQDYQGLPASQSLPSEEAARSAVEQALIGGIETHQGAWNAMVEGTDVEFEWHDGKTSFCYNDQEITLRVKVEIVKAAIAVIERMQS